MKTFSAALLLALIVASVAVMWNNQKWATSIPEVGAFMLAALWTILFMARRQTARLSSVMIPLAGTVLWAAVQIQTGVTVYENQTWLAILYWAGNLATFFVAGQIFADAEIRKRFFRWLLIFGFIISVVSSLQTLTAGTKIFWIFPTEYRGILVGPFVYHNQFAAFVELLLPLALYRALTESKWRAFDILIAATLYAAVVVSASRAGFALATAELLFIPALMLARRAVGGRQAVTAAALLAGMVILLALAAGPEVIAGRFALKDPYAIRREFVVSSLAMFRDKPLLGVGLGNWPVAYPGYAIFDDGTFANQAHNDWVQWAVEGGLPLLALQLWIAVWAIPRAFRSGWGLGVVAIFIHRFVDYPLQRPAVALVFFTILGALDALDAHQGTRASAAKDGSTLLHLV